MEDFIAASQSTKEILNSAKLLQSVDIHALVFGEEGVGKKTLAKYILPDARFYEAAELQKDIAENVVNITETSIILNKIEN